MSQISKKEILERLRTERARLEAAIAGLSEETMHQPGVVGHWSIKDVLAHLAAWEAELVTALWYNTIGRRPRLADIRDVDAWNERRYQENKDRPLERILNDFRNVYEQLLRRVEALSDEELDDPHLYEWTGGQTLAEVIAENSYAHEAEHAEQIEAYRQQVGL